MRLSLRLFAWFLATLNGSGLLLLRWLGIPETSHRHIHSPEEIGLLIVESRDGGLLEPDEERRLHQALRLGLRTARQLMVPRRDVVAIDADAPPEVILATLLETRYTRLPVYRGSIDDVVGLLHTKRAATQLLEHGRLARVTRLLQPLQSVPETLRADQLLRFFRQHRTVIALVIDEFGGTAGLVTIQDVLQELLGEMADEFRPADPAPARLADGRVRLPGRMRKDDAAPLVGTHWRGESDTVGGLVVETLGYLPAPGERLTIEDVPIEVERVQDRMVTWVIATPRSPMDSAIEEHHHHG